MSYLTDLIADQQEQLLSQLIDLYQVTLSKIEQIHLNQINFSTKILKTVSEAEKRLEESNRKALSEIERKHDQEINSHQTVALKMSMFKEYDRQIKEYQDKLQLAERRISQLTAADRNEVASRAKPLSQSTPVRTSEGDAKNSVHSPKEEAVRAADKPGGDDANSAHSPKEEEVRAADKPGGDAKNSARSPKKEAVRPDPEPVPIGREIDPREEVESKQKRRRIKWKGEVYFYDPNSLDVYRSECDKESIGRKEDKKLVLR
jgi:hypothetical protein